MSYHTEIWVSCYSYGSLTRVNISLLKVLYFLDIEFLEKILKRYSVTLRHEHIKEGSINFSFTKLYNISSIFIYQMIDSEIPDYSIVSNLVFTSVYHPIWSILYFGPINMKISL